MAMAAAKAPALTSDAILHHNAWGEDVAQTDHLSGNAILRGNTSTRRLIFDGLAWLTHGKMTLVIGQILLKKTSTLFNFCARKTCQTTVYSSGCLDKLLKNEAADHKHG